MDRRNWARLVKVWHAFGSCVRLLPGLRFELIGIVLDDQPVDHRPKRWW